MTTNSSAPHQLRNPSILSDVNINRRILDIGELKILIHKLKENNLLNDVEKILLEQIIHHKSDLNLRIELAETYMSRKMWNNAIPHWRYILNNFETYPKGVFIRLCISFLEVSEFSEAEDIAGRLLEKYPRDERGLALLDEISSKKSTLYELEIEREAENTDSRTHIDSKIGVFGAIDLRKFLLKGWIENPADADYALAIELRDGSVTTYPLNQDRRDVVEYLENVKKGTYKLRCGYAYELDLLNVKRIGFKKTATTIWSHSLRLKAISKVLRGRDNWLFLANDTNQSADIFTGKLLLSNSLLNEWNVYFTKVKRLQMSRNCAFLLAPSKESVFPDYYPMKRGEETITDQLFRLRSFLDIDPIFPLDELSRIDGSYYKTDTHWSDLGAYIAVQECMTTFGLRKEWDEYFEFNPIIGYSDLGTKLDPIETDFAITALPSSKTVLSPVFQNHVPSSGNVVVFHNREAPIDKKLLIFGDSFSGIMLKLFPVIFKDVVRIYSPATPVMDVVEHENADFILLQTNERFLTKPSEFARTLQDSTLGMRIKKATKEEKINMQRRLNSNNIKNIYYNFMSSALSV